MAYSHMGITDLNLCRHCNQIFTDPCKLPCRHVLCRHCFMEQEEQNLPSSDGKNFMIRRCPLCKAGSKSDGSELILDERTACLIRISRELPAELLQDIAIRRIDCEICSLPNCTEPAAGFGLDYEGRLCEQHLGEDAGEFAQRLASVQLIAEERLNRVKLLAKKQRTVLNEMIIDRAEVSDLFDEIETRLRECRQESLSRMDSVIENLESELRSLDALREIEVQIGKANKSGNKHQQYQLCRQVTMAVKQKNPSEKFNEHIDITLELTRGLLATIKSQTAGIPDCGYSRLVEFNKGPCSTLLNSSLISVNAVIFSCKAATNILITKELPYFFMAFGKRRDKVFSYVEYFDNTGVPIGLHALPMRRKTLVSVHCANHLQRLYLLLSDPSLLVTDLAGTQLHEVVTLQMERALCVTGSGEKIYILGSNGQLVILSAESAEIQERVQLSSELLGAQEIVAYGNSLLLATDRSVTQFNLDSGYMFKFWSPDSISSEGLSSYSNTSIFRVASIGYGFVAVWVRSSKSVTIWILSRSGVPIAEIPCQNGYTCLLFDGQVVSRQNDITCARRITPFLVCANAKCIN